MQLSELIIDKSYFVAYVDLLGFSNLSRESTKNEDLICNILKKIHSFIYDEQIKYEKNIATSVISDSIFIISDNLLIILRTLSQVYRKCISNGILLRTGLSYGDCKVLQTNLSQNIYGDAVSRAVHLEGTGKGCKIFIDDTVPSQLTKKEVMYGQTFCPYKNIANYSILDVFEWPMVNGDDVYIKGQDENKTKEIILSNLKLINSLKFSPDYTWNVSSPEGRLQICATIDYISSIVEKMRKENTDIKENFQFEFDCISEIKERKYEIVNNRNTMYKKLLHITEN